MARRPNNLNQKRPVNPNREEGDSPAPHPAHGLRAGNDV
jgi:hypothetical protein